MNLFSPSQIRSFQSPPRRQRPRLDLPANSTRANHEVQQAKGAWRWKRDDREPPAGRGPPLGCTSTRGPKRRPGRGPPPPPAPALSNHHRTCPPTAPLRPEPATRPTMVANQVFTGRSFAGERKKNFDSRKLKIEKSEFLQQ